MLRGRWSMRWGNWISRMIVKILGLILLVAAVLKGYQLLTEPVANNDLWSYRPFLIVQVECELALGLWLLAGLFPRAAWLAALACFSLFSLVTLYKGVTGAASCGCFGSVHVNPWITLTAIDLPAAIALSLFRPRSALTPLWSFLCRQESLRHVIAEFTNPRPSLPRFAATAALGMAALGVTAPILAFNKPAAVTAAYEILEPETWVGKELPILQYIDIGDQIKTGRWLLLFYHYDCPDCQEAIPRYERMARDLAANEDFLRVALIEVPPYGPGAVSSDSPCGVGQLSIAKEWFVATPVTALTCEGQVAAVWEEQAPHLEAVFQEILHPKVALLSERTNRSKVGALRCQAGESSHAIERPTCFDEMRLEVLGVVRLIAPTTPRLADQGESRCISPGSRWRDDAEATLRLISCRGKGVVPMV